MNIKRYNQGFGNFGPMEQCNDGKWVKADDVLPKLTSLDKEFSELISDLNEATWDRDYYKNKLSTCNENLKFSHKREDSYFRMTVTLASLGFIEFLLLAVVFIRQFVGG